MRPALAIDGTITADPRLFQRHLSLKVDYALAHALAHFVDDDPKVLALLARFAPSVTAIGFEDRGRLLQHPTAAGDPQ